MMMIILLLLLHAEQPRRQQDRALSWLGRDPDSTLTRLGGQPSARAVEIEARSQDGPPWPWMYIQRTVDADVDVDVDVRRLVPAKESSCPKPKPGQGEIIPAVCWGGGWGMDEKKTRSRFETSHVSGERRRVDGRENAS